MMVLVLLAIGFIVNPNATKSIVSSGIAVASKATGLAARSVVSQVDKATK